MTGCQYKTTSKTTIPIFALILVMLPVPCSAEIAEEVLVTGSHIDFAVPGRSLRRSGDNLLIRIEITNDARDEEQREKEIHETLLQAISSADGQKGVELSSVTDSGFVIPLRRSNHRIELSKGDRPDTSRAYFRVKSAIPPSAEDGEALVLDLKRFVSKLTMVGRTEVIVERDVEVSVINPNQYRPDVIALMAEDIENVTSALGDDYRVVVSGIDKPIAWARIGSLDVSIFIPYEYVVVPTTISSFNLFPDY